MSSKVLGIQFFENDKVIKGNPELSKTHVYPDHPRLAVEEHALHRHMCKNT